MKWVRLVIKAVLAEVSGPDVRAEKFRNQIEAKELNCAQSLLFFSNCLICFSASSWVMP
jgi:hypothetical protein